MVIKTACNLPFDNEFDESVRAFEPYITLGEVPNVFIEFKDDSDSEISLMLVAGHYQDSKKIVKISGQTTHRDKALLRREGKIMLYNYLVKMSGISLPYGSLTGIRPTKHIHEMESLGLDGVEYLTRTYSVDTKTASFLKEIVDNQKGIYGYNKKEIDLFVNIPICVSRCSYCSFISAEYGKIKGIVSSYVDQLIEEISQSIEMIADYNLTLRAVYVGGGTPTSLDEVDFERVMRALSNLSAREFTVEAGRPDTISMTKLESMARAGVDRISINPQTFNEETLIEIGRSHNIDDIKRVYNMARAFPFVINMDLIAMLPNESLDMFCHSVREAIALNPDNITIHTLSIKKGSRLKIINYDNQKDEVAQKMVEFSKKALTENGYKPYYMYKQKYMSGNLENTGYARGGKCCIYNIDIMEETHSILACGAGGISKRVTPLAGAAIDIRIERLANPKGIDVYLDRREIISQQKRAFFAEIKLSK